jgi:hypothetical protein
MLDLIPATETFTSYKPHPPMPIDINGFDPLMTPLPYDSIEFSDKSMFENAIKGNVESILRCYTGFFDIFSEMIQNSLDATEKKFKSNSDYTPKIFIEINIKEQTLRVVDNGSGMSIDEFLLCFRPNFTFKKGQNLRGSKGVGATFLAYGYNYIKLQTKIGSNKYAAVLRQGRLWVEDTTNKLSRPKLEREDFDVSELAGEYSGTSIEIKLTGKDFEKPKDFGWYGATVATQWFDILRIVTPLGGIYLKSIPFQPHVYITVIDRTGISTKFDKKKAEFYYPHEIPDIVQADLFEIRSAFKNIDGDIKTQSQKLPDKFKNLQLIWEIWNSSELLTSDYLKLELDESERILIEQFEICVYASQVDSLETFSTFNETLGIRQKTKLLRGGIQLATDGMPQGDLLQISLNRQSGLQDYTFIIVHFKSGNPDTGRKNFQPELKGIAEKLATHITRFIILYRDLLRFDTGSIRNMKPAKDRHVWIKRLENWRDQNPLPDAINENFTYLSKPQEEQDVIAVFNQFVGAGIIKGIYFYSNEYNEKYDSLFELKYNESFKYSSENPLGVRIDYPYFNDVSEPKVLEYKFGFDSLLKDFKNDKKFPEQIDLVVCWQAASIKNSNVILKSLLLEKEGSRRFIYGSTHQAVIPGISNNAAFEVIILEDLINFLSNPEREIANQRIKYSID